MYVLDADTVGIRIVLQNELLQVQERPLVLCVLPHLWAIRVRHASASHLPSHMPHDRDSEDPIPTLLLLLTAALANITAPRE